jgi:site-specific DNA-methyltransferase (adenine-specific)
LGSGSSAIAAIKTGCKFLGCDISEKSVLATQKRVQHFFETKLTLIRSNHCYQMMTQ